MLTGFFDSRSSNWKNFAAEGLVMEAAQQADLDHSLSLPHGHHRLSTTVHST